MAKGVILDTSFLISMAQGPIKGLDDLELTMGKVTVYVTDGTIGELQRLSGAGKSRRKGAKRMKAARLALDYAKNLQRAEAPKSSDVDEEILACAREKGYAVATLDSGLMKRLREERLAVITLRSEKIYVSGSVV